MKFSHCYIAVVGFLRDEGGPTSVEYAVMLAMIAATVIGSVALVSNATVENFDDASDAISDAFGS